MATDIEKAQKQRLPATVAEIRQFIAPLATDQEAYIFLRYCQAQDLNPFAKDAYLIKYDAKAPAAIVIGIQALLKRAAHNKTFKGYQSGVVVTDKTGTRQEIEGSLVDANTELVGGWCELYRSDWPHPLKVVVALKEYNKRQAQWIEKPATMIEKVALAQALRRAFPEDIGQLYEQGLSVEVMDTEDMPRPMAFLPPQATQEADPDGTHSNDEAWPQTEASVASILTTCPAHGETWLEGKGGSLWHKMPKGQELCSLSRILGAKFQGVREELQPDWNKEQTDDWLKKQLGGTWSKLTPQQMLDAPERLLAAFPHPAPTPDTVSAPEIAVASTLDPPQGPREASAQGAQRPQPQIWTQTTFDAWGKQQGKTAIEVETVLSKYLAAERQTWTQMQALCAAAWGLELFPEQQGTP